MVLVHCLRVRFCLRETLVILIVWLDFNYGPAVAIQPVDLRLVAFRVPFIVLNPLLLAAWGERFRNRFA